MGQYIWDIINPNPGRWRSGVRLIHHLMAMHKDDATIQQRTMRTLGEKYFIFFQDYARAAFWWQQAGVDFGEPDSVYLAECYWRLGNQAMAQELLVDPDRLKPGNNPLRAEMIKLWGDMGQLNKALKLTEMYLRSGGDAHTALLMAGDACRTAGRFTDALKFYQRACRYAGRRTTAVPTAISSAPRQMSKRSGFSSCPTYRRRATARTAPRARPTKGL